MRNSAGLSSRALEISARYSCSPRSLARSLSLSLSPSIALLLSKSSPRRERVVCLLFSLSLDYCMPDDDDTSWRLYELLFFSIMHPLHPPPWRPFFFLSLSPPKRRRPGDPQEPRGFVRLSADTTGDGATQRRKKKKTTLAVVLRKMGNENKLTVSSFSAKSAPPQFLHFLSLFGIMPVGSSW